MENSNLKHIIKIKSNEEVKTGIIFGLLSMSFEDYISARILFNNNKLLQGCILANTAIEKSFKALLEFQGINFKLVHDLTKLLPSIKNQYPSILKKINVEFLEQLTKIYKARYIDGLPVDYNFAIIQTKYLAELDYTFSLLEPIFRTPKNNNSNNITKYENAVATKDVNLWSNNYLLNGFDKTSFIENKCYVYEFRKISKDKFFEILYLSNNVKNESKFNYQALIPSNEYKTYTLTHEAFQ